MDDELANSLLISIDNDRLVALAGAGLSMSPPSEMPSAAALAKICADKFREKTGNPLPIHLHSDIEQMADHFIGRGEFQQVFIEDLVPWSKFKWNPNPGHEAIADFLGCDVFQFVITTNIDTLVERAAANIGESDFYATVEDRDLNRGGIEHAPLLKVHSCNERDRDHTIWSRSQFTDQVTVNRIAAFKKWLEGQLMGRDLIVIGYWTDWDYLDELLLDSVRDHAPGRVIVVNPSKPEDLQAKAPGLWEWASSDAVNFSHLPMSASDFLEELRRRFSERYLNRILESSVETYETLTKKQFADQIELSPGMTIADLYAKRREFSGLSSTEVVRSKKPSINQQLIGAIHLILIEGGATMDGPNYILNGKRYRLIQGTGQVISRLKERFSGEPPNPSPAEITVCAGAYPDGGAPDNLIREGQPESFLRPATSGSWISEGEFLHDHGIVHQ